MALQIYNTLKKKREKFSPLKDNEVRMYVCGPTLYDELHLGNARAAIIFDVIRRYLEYKGYKVNYITNFTDVDDKMIDRAKILGISIFELAERFAEVYFQQMKLLGVKKADGYPRATKHIKEIIDLIKRLEEKGLAYPQNGDVFFRIKRFSPYGKLSHQNLKELSIGARVEVNEKKEDPLDFALWKEAKKGEPFWDSPWGKGRPGWHIECSAMAMKFLGESIDIHGGGEDLIFPHHENEIAQSEGATGKTFARYWVHNGHLTMKKEKMSKSLGNVLTLSQTLKIYSGEVIRYFLLSAHYRSSLDYTEESLKEAASSLERVYNFLARIEEIKEERLKGSPSSGLREKIKDLSQYLEKMDERFDQAMDDDFNTSLALSTIFELVKKANFLLREEHNLNDSSREVLLKTKEKIRAKGKILGLFQKEKREGLGKEEQLIELLIKIRDELRKKKDWVLADKIRKELDVLGIKLEDRKKATVWRIKSY